MMGAIQGFSHYGTAPTMTTKVIHSEVGERVLRTRARQRAPRAIVRVGLSWRPSGNKGIIKMKSNDGSFMTADIKVVL